MVSPAPFKDSLIRQAYQTHPLDGRAENIQDMCVWSTGLYWRREKYKLETGTFRYLSFCDAKPCTLSNLKNLIEFLFPGMNVGWNNGPAFLYRGIKQDGTWVKIAATNKSQVVEGLNIRRNTADMVLEAIYKTVEKLYRGPIRDVSFYCIMRDIEKDEYKIRYAHHHDSIFPTPMNLKKVVW